MKVLIVGAGAMGCLFASLLADHADIRLITSRPDHKTAITNHGLVVQGLDGQQRHVKVRFAADGALEQWAADLVLICTKARDTETAARTALRYLAPNGLVLTLQNGLGNVEVIAAQVGTQRTVAGTTAQAATLLGPGQVRHAGRGITSIGLQRELEVGITQVAAVFNQAGIPCELEVDIDRLIWSKLIVNVGINALAAIFRVPNGVLALVPECSKLMEEAVIEAVAVARALAIAFAADEQIQRVKQVCSETSVNHASMLQDIIRGKRTEIDVINGAIVAKGRAVGVPVPVNALLTRVIKALEATVAHRV